MDYNNEHKNSKTPELKPKQDSFRPWLKLIPAAAVFAAVCVTCYQADKSPVETTSVSNNNVMSTDEIKELISQGTAGKDFDSEDSSETNGTSISKTSKKTKKTSKIKTGTKKNSSPGSSANGGTAGGGAGSTVTPTTEVPAGGQGSKDRFLKRSTAGHYGSTLSRWLCASVQRIYLDGSLRHLRLCGSIFAGGNGNLQRCGYCDPHVFP